jgi:hypothetical protein
MDTVIKTQYTCKRCNTALQGRADYCVLCYSKLYINCPDCTYRLISGRILVRTKSGHTRNKGKNIKDMDCSRCNNERYILQGE